MIKWTRFYIQTEYQTNCVLFSLLCHLIDNTHKWMYLVDSIESKYETHSTIRQSKINKQLQPLPRCFRLNDLDKIGHCVQTIRLNATRKIHRKRLVVALGMVPWKFRIYFLGQPNIRRYIKI